MALARALLTLSLCTSLLGVAVAITVPRHASESLHDSPFPSVLNTPELHAARAVRRLAAPAADGSFAHEHSAHEFTGITKRGFIDFSYSAVLRNTSVRLGDYDALLSTATYACARSADATTAIAVRIAIPRAAVVAEAHAAAHLALRLREQHVIVFDADALASHPSFARGTDCAALVHLSSVSFTIADIRASALSEGGWEYALELQPAQPTDIFHMLSWSYDWDPNVTRAISSRRERGLPLGDPAAISAHDEGRRELYIFDRQATFLNVNWNKNTGARAAAKNSNIQLISGNNGLNCKNCYLYATAGIHAELSFCARASVLGFTKYFDSEGNENAPICKALTGSADLGISALAYAYGSAGYNFELTSEGIPSPYTTCASNKKTDAIDDGTANPTCVKNAWPQGDFTPSNGGRPSDPGGWSPAGGTGWGVNMGELSFPVGGGISITIVGYGQLDYALRVPTPIVGTLNVGSGAGVAMTLGGGATLPSMSSSITYKSLNDWYNSYDPIPLKMTLTSDKGSLEAVIIPRLTLSLWNTIPIILSPSVRFIAAFGKSDTNVAATSRALLTATSSCTTGTTPYVFAASMDAGVTLGAVTYKNIVNKLSGDVLGFAFSGNLFDQYDLYSGTITEQTPIASGCIAAGAPLTVQTQMKSNAPPAAAPVSSLGAIIGGVIGGIVGVVIIVAIIYCVVIRRKTPASNTGGGNTIILAQQPQQPQLVLKEPVVVAQQPQPVVVAQQPQPVVVAQQPQPVVVAQQPPTVTVIRM